MTMTTMLGLLEAMSIATIVNKLQGIELQLNKDTRQRYESYIDPKHKYRSLIGKLLAVYIADLYFDEKLSLENIHYACDGYPIFLETSLAMSISYCQSAIAIGISRTKSVGVDLDNRVIHRTDLPIRWQHTLAKKSIHSWLELEAFAKYYKKGLKVIYHLDDYPELYFKHIDCEENLQCCLALEKPAKVVLEKVHLEDLLIYIEKLNNDIL